MTLRWAYGVTTVAYYRRWLAPSTRKGVVNRTKGSVVESRRYTLLPRTLDSLRAAGFPNPRLFIDKAAVKEGVGYYEQFGLSVSPRYPALRTAAHWILSFAELIVRNPQADRYALFQDDMVAVRNLRQYLDRVPYPDKGYLNLFTMTSNSLRSLRAHRIPSPKEGYTGFYQSNQNGRGAVALVFDRAAAVALLGRPFLWDRCRANTHEERVRCYKSVDGGIVTAMHEAGYREYCHEPSLVQHTGEASSIGNLPHKPAPVWPGENQDALDFLRSGQQG